MCCVIAESSQRPQISKKYESVETQNHTLKHLVTIRRLLLSISLHKMTLYLLGHRLHLVGCQLSTISQSSMLAFSVDRN